MILEREMELNIMDDLLSRNGPKQRPILSELAHVKHAMTSMLGIGEEHETT